MITVRAATPQEVLDEALRAACEADAKVSDARKARLLALTSDGADISAESRAYHAAKDAARDAWIRAKRAAIDVTVTKGIS